MTDYQNYLEKVHAQFSTPDEVLTQAALKAAGSAITEKKRIIAGEDNEVYAAKLKNNQEVIIRISQWDNDGFSKEEWAIKHASKKGVPTPAMLFREILDSNGMKKGLCVMEKIGGDPLERGGIDYGTMDKEVLRKIINQAGQILSLIHQVPTEGFGDLDTPPRGYFKTFSDLLNERVDQKERYIQIAQKFGLDANIFLQSLTILKDKSGKFTDIKPVLNHDDFGPKHFMIKDNNIVGIIDWGSATSNSPVNDFANWQFWWDEIPLEWLKEGYSNKSLFDNNFDELMHLLMLNRGVNAVLWYDEGDYAEGTKYVEMRLKEVLEYFDSKIEKE